MGIESDTLDALDAFSDKTATLATVSVSVMVDLDVDVVDSEGNTRQVAALVTTKKVGFPVWSAGDRLVAAIGVFKLQELIADDGFVLTISATHAT